MASKGQKFKKWTAEEKFKIIEPALNFEKSTWDITRESGLNNEKRNNSFVEYKRWL
jgi:hypothetical protein